MSTDGRSTVGSGLSKDVISHDRRRILHFNVTKHPTSSWIVQQLREAFPFGSVPRFVIFDRDAKYGLEVPAAVRSLRVNPVHTSFESPWQNGVAEQICTIHRRPETLSPLLHSTLSPEHSRLRRSAMPTMHLFQRVMQPPWAHQRWRRRCMY